MRCPFVTTRQICHCCAMIVPARGLYSARPDDAGMTVGFLTGGRPSTERVQYRFLLPRVAILYKNKLCLEPLRVIPGSR